MIAFRPNADQLFALKLFEVAFHAGNAAPYLVGKQGVRRPAMILFACMIAQQGIQQFCPMTDG